MNRDFFINMTLTGLGFGMVAYSACHPANGMAKAKINPRTSAYYECMVGKIATDFRSLGYGRTATEETNRAIYDAAQEGAWVKCQKLYPKHLKHNEQEDLAADINDAVISLQSIETETQREAKKKHHGK